MSIGAVGNGIGQNTYKISSSSYQSGSIDVEALERQKENLQQQLKMLEAGSGNNSKNAESLERQKKTIEDKITQIEEKIQKISQSKSDNKEISLESNLIENNVDDRNLYSDENQETGNYVDTYA